MTARRNSVHRGGESSGQELSSVSGPGKLQRLGKIRRSYPRQSVSSECHKFRDEAQAWMERE